MDLILSIDYGLDQPYGAEPSPAQREPPSVVDTWFQPAFVRPPPAVSVAPLDDQQAGKPSQQLQPKQQQQPQQAQAPSHVHDPQADMLSVPHLGDPQLMGELPTTDPLTTLLNKHLPTHMRPTRDLSGSWQTQYDDPYSSFTPPSTSSQIDAAAVQEAIATNSWRRIATLSRSKIEEYATLQQTNLINISTSSEENMRVPQVLEWWSVRLYSLCRLRLYSMMRTEMLGLWSVLESTKVTQIRTLATSPLVPFSLRVLKAAEPRLRGELKQSIDAHVQLLMYCKAWMARWRKAAIRLARQNNNNNSSRKIDSGEKEKQVQDIHAQQKVWKDRALRIGVIIAHMLAEARDYPTAIHLIEPLVTRTIPANEDEVNSQIHLLSLLARLYLQAGSLSSATELFDQASHLVSKLTTETYQLQANYLVTKNAALSAASCGLYDIAESKFRSLIESKQDDDGTLLNDLAISMFYQGQLQQPIQVLEGMLATSPSSVTNIEPFIFNLCTLHEVRSDDAVNDKRRILTLVGQWAGEGCGTACLKLA